MKLSDPVQPVPSIICIGGAVLDRKYKAKAELAPGTSNPVSGFRSFGGVARNVTENLGAARRVGGVRHHCRRG